MLSNLRAGGRYLAAGALALLACSCGDGRPRPYPTKGAMRVNGQPAKGVVVTLYAPDKGTPVAEGESGEDGVFTMTTYKLTDGVPAGDYDVGLTWPAWRTGKSDGPDRLQGQFVDPKKTGLKAHVEAAENTLPPIEITAQVLPPSSQAEHKSLKKQRQEDRAKEALPKR